MDSTNLFSSSWHHGYPPISPLQDGEGFKFILNHFLQIKSRGKSCYIK
jgi:hypothetical protein